MHSKGSILVLGGTGKVSSRMVPLLSCNGYTTLVASRSGRTPSLPNCEGVKFDWFDTTTYRVLDSTSISAVFLVSPPVLQPFEVMKEFIDLAVSRSVKRFVLLSASVLPVGDGNMMAGISKYISELNVEYAILRPSWFMENFSEMLHAHSIRDQDSIITATGEGKVPFVSAEDIAAVGFRALTVEKSYDTDLLIMGPELLSYDDIAAHLSALISRPITHVKITEDSLATTMTSFGVPADYARNLAAMDTYIKEGKDAILSDVVKRVTGKKPRTFEDFASEVALMGVWEKK